MEPATMRLRARTPRGICLLCVSAAMLIVIASCRDTRRPNLARPGAPAATAPTSEPVSEVNIKGFFSPPAPGRGVRMEEEVKALNQSCVACHVETDKESMHVTAVSLACVECHWRNKDA